MEFTPIMRGVHLGRKMEVLGQTREGMATHGKLGTLNAWRRVARQLSALNFPETRCFLARELRGVMKELKNRPPSSEVDANSSQTIQAAMPGAWQELEAEARHRFTATPGPSKMKEQHLLKNPAALFDQGVFAKLPELAQEDFAEAAQCLAFSLCTAGACLIVRASECVLRESAVVWGLIVPPKGWKSWGEVGKGLRDKAPPKPPLFCWTNWSKWESI